MNKFKNLRFRPPVFLFVILGLFLLLIIPLIITSCNDVRVQTITWVEYEPVYMTHEEFAKAVDIEEPRDLKNPGKIYFYDGYLFVNEINKGVHIIDNRDPSNPVNTGFINIPANKDIAVRDELLYADSQKDLLVFDISNLQQADLLHRVEDVFNVSANRPPGFTTQIVDNSRGLVVDWKEVIKEEICEGNCRSHPAHRFGGGFLESRNGFTTAAGGDAAGGGGGAGTGGSMARFAINGDYLYAVDHNDLTTFNISSPNASKVNKQNVGWAIETIFPYNDNLFIGSEHAMYIYELTNPASPNQLSVYWHATACDPVVVEGDYAFVTLRKTPTCPLGVNQLDVVDVKDLANPKKVKFYEMINPHGLGIDNGNLFISEGEHGLKIMDASNPYDIKLLRHITGLKTYDVIPMNGVLMVTGADGIVQYDYSDIHNLVHLSTIHVIKD